VEQEIKPTKNLNSDTVEADGRRGSVENRPPVEVKERVGSWLLRNMPYLVILSALFIWITKFDPDNMLSFLKMVLGLGMVIFIHELGHFLVAKWCDVHVETFSIGFGPPIPGCMFRRGETTYMIALIPLGGYVKMVGEGPEEEHEDDPRSFKNKPVWQRMAIISAGVTMNLLLAFACFVFVFRTHGAQRAPGVVGQVQPGSPAWQKGMRSGDVIYWVGNQGPRPYFDDILPTIVNSNEGEEIKLVYGPPGSPEKDWTYTSIVARKDEDDSYPVIGIRSAMDLHLVPPKFHKIHELPVLFDSAAAKAEPPFQFGDSIIATSDPDDPGRVKPLPPDPRASEDPNHLDYFEFQRRLHRLAGKEMIIQVRRYHSEEIVNISVPPAYHYTLGLRMPMGKVVAVRDDSPAAKAGLKPEDIIEKVEMTGPDGRKIRFPGEIKDSLRLPYEMEQWAAKASAPKLIILTVSQNNPLSSQSGPGNFPERKRVTLTIPWEDGWEFNNDNPLTLSSPLSIPGLGVAFRVETTVLDVDTKSPATQAIVEKTVSIVCEEGEVIQRKNGEVKRTNKGEALDLEAGDQIALKKGDVVKAVQFQIGGRKQQDKPKPDDWLELKPDQWARVFERLQEFEIKRVGLRLERGPATLEVSLTAVEDKTWPGDERGIRPFLEPDRRLQKADTLRGAFSLGVNETISFTGRIFGSLRAIITRRVSLDNVGGPLTIGLMAFHIAGEDIYQFLIFLGIIGVNLAVINFLPIPILDGGHMAFLIYEWIRGKPAPEAVRVAATYVGLALILSLLLLVSFFDIKRLLSIILHG
jgi:regulator of sigma E protease